MSDQAPVAIVTGASRGAGRGIAIALGQHGCTVYVSGRSEKTGDHPLPGTIYETAEAVTKAGGKGIAVRCDHADDAQTKALIEQVEREQGRIDILVNNAAAVYDELTTPGNFWEKPLKLVDMIDVGLRSGYVATYHAAPKMVARRHGLVLFTSPCTTCSARPTARTRPGWTSSPTTWRSTSRTSAWPPCRSGWGPF
jgi:NAD(P)-dependent dehydrogenase (short-subunit alcohol dehydrogenase family)